MQPNDARIIRGAAAFTAAAAVVALIVGALTAGGRGVVGVGLGLLISTAFFASGLLALTWIGERRPDLFFAAAMGIYLAQAIVLLVLMLLLRDATFLSGPAFASGVFVGMAAWLSGQLRATLTAKTPYVVTERDTADSVEDAR